jgi:GT2 family glycosyltransferase
MVPLAAPDTATVALHLVACRPGITVRPGNRSGTPPVAVTDAWLQVDVDGPSQELVNSAGVVLGDDGFAADRGYLEPDEGQYDRADEVEAWSGAAVLLRRAYLEDVGPFDEALFLYYEDVDLSLRGRARGWRYGYVPSSVVRHAHSASTGTDSPLVSYYNDRNRLLVLARHGSPRAVAAATGRFLAVTAAYARRDLQGLLPRACCVPEQGRTRPRIRAFAGFLRRLPAQAARRARGH